MSDRDWIDISTGISDERRRLVSRSGCEGCPKAREFATGIPVDLTFVSRLLMGSLPGHEKPEDISRLLLMLAE